MKIMFRSFSTGGSTMAICLNYFTYVPELGAQDYEYICKLHKNVVNIEVEMDLRIVNGKQKHLRCKKVAWPRKTVTKRGDMRVWPR